MTWKSKLEANSKYVHAIGMITIEMANVEMFLGRLLSEVLEVAPNIGQAIYWAPKSACARIKILKSAAKQKFKPIPLDDSLNIELHQKATATTLKVIKKLLDRSTSCIGRRNDIIHGVWGQNSATGAISSGSTLTFLSPV
ncbi:MAG: hypothetical protein ACR2KT_01150 [Methylocella sp.]